MPPRSAKLLEDIRQSGRHILNDVAGLTFTVFIRNRLVRQAVERNFEIVGEATRRLVDADLETAEQIENYRDAIGLRNVIIHNYDRVDPAALWETIETTLPTLLNDVEALLAEFDSDGLGVELSDPAS